MVRSDLKGGPQTNGPMSSGLGLVNTTVAVSTSPPGRANRAIRLPDRAVVLRGIESKVSGAEVTRKRERNAASARIELDSGVRFKRTSSSLFRSSLKNAP